VGVAADPASHKVYVADTFDNQIKVITLPADTVTIYAGTGARGFLDGPALSAKFNRPEGVSVGQGNVYVSDTGNDRIRLIASSIATGVVVTTYGGTGVLGYTGDGGPATQAEINLFEPMNSDQNVMQSMGAAGMNCNTQSGTKNNQALCALSFPTGVASSTQPGEVFLSDTDNNHVRAITPGAPPVIPESTYTLLLPLSAVALIGGGYVLVRRRSRQNTQATVSL
jgi:hypothetical protein